MKTFKKVLIAALLLVFVFALAACGGGGNTPKSGTGKKDDKGGKTAETGSGLQAKDIKAIADLSDYGAKPSDYNKDKTKYDYGTKSYDGKDCSAQLTKLQDRIDEKHGDVMSGESTSSFVKIFALSTAEELLQRMANAALNFDEMDRVVDYLSGTRNAELSPYLVASTKDEETKVWTGKFATGSEWRSEKYEGKPFNTGWSFFDDWELYDRLKDYADTKGMEQDEKDLAGDNAAWQYRSILQKVYEDVRLEGNSAARLATHMLDYAIDIVENQSGGSIDSAITDSGLGDFALYCKRAPAENDPFYGLQDYETLSYLLSFNEYYTNTDGLINCVRLYGYYYDYNKRYYEKCLKDEDTYAKQLKYEKMSVFTDAEWKDYVGIQRSNYINAYRYTTSFYRTFYTYHFEFQGIIENYDDKVYEINRMIENLGATNTKTTYTKEMQSAVRQGAIDGLAGQLAMSDWEWCYGGDETAMKNYNAANTKYENGKKGSSEEENEGKFYYEMEQLKMVKYLFANMTDAELSGALYYNVYSYSASMVKKMQGYIKNIVYIIDKVEPGAQYTNIAQIAKTLNKSNEYAQEKIKVLYDQAYADWRGTDVSTKAKNASSQAWSTMETEIDTALNYDYENMEIIKREKQWAERVERLEDLVIARKWSCCGQKVSEAVASKCETGHAANKDGTIATKEYDTDHKISLFVSNYEEVIYHIAGKVTISFQTPIYTDAKPGYQTRTTEELTWNAGYDGTISVLRSGDPIKTMEWEERQSYTIASGKLFSAEVEEVGEADKKWWDNNKVGTTNTDPKDRDYPKKNTANGIEIVESTPSGNITFIYTYVFKGWYLDKDCKYEFDEDDEMEIPLTVYAGYNVTKKRKA